MAIKLHTEEHQRLKVSCDRSDCENGLHCFRTSKKKAVHKPGLCQACGADLVDWSRVKMHSSLDVDNTFSELKKEWIRHHYFHEPIDQHARNHALRKGRAGLKIAVPKRLRSTLRVGHPREGRQTGWSGNVVLYAQHATACCCRRCLEYWHGIPKDRELTDSEIQYLTELCLRYVDERMPGLADDGKRVPPIRNGDLR